MKCLAARKEKKPRMSKEERAVYNAIDKRYRQLRMKISHEEAIEQLKKEAQDAELTRKNTEDNRAVHEVRSDDVEERKD